MRVTLGSILARGISGLLLRNFNYGTNTRKPHNFLYIHNMATYFRLPTATLKPKTLNPSTLNSKPCARWLTGLLHECQGLVGETSSLQSCGLGFKVLGFGV